MRYVIGRQTRALAAAILLAAAARTPLASQEPAGRCITAAEALVPRFVLEAARTGTLSDFAGALAAGRVCAGFVVRQKAAGDVTRPWRYEAPEPTARISDAIALFQQRHKDLTIEHVNSILLVRDLAVDLKASPLSKTAPHFEVHDVPAVEALRQAAKLIAPESAAPEGVAGSYLSRPEDPPVTREDLQGPNVSTRLSNVTFLDILTDIGGRAPGVVWMLKASGSPQKDTAFPDTTYELAGFLRRGTQWSVAKPIH